MDALQTLTPVLRRDGHAVRQDLPDHFSSHCARVGELILAVNRNYSEFTVREAAEQRLAQIRSLVAGQFGTVSRMLEDMAGELELYERFDFAAARRVTESLRAMGLLPLDVSCRVDRFGRMTVEAEAARGEKSRLSRSEICREVSRACGKPFELPCVSTAQGKCRIQMSEKPVYRVAAGFSQHICGNGTLCGDSYEYFSDGFGRQAAVLSDGMGSGGRAAVDGAMASGILSRLLQAGRRRCRLSIRLSSPNPGTSLWRRLTWFCSIGSAGPPISTKPGPPFPLCGIKAVRLWWTRPPSLWGFSTRRPLPAATTFSATAI